MDHLPFIATLPDTGLHISYHALTGMTAEGYYYVMQH